MIHATIIIPTCNRPADLERCLRALQPQLQQHPCEVIVSDDSRDDRTQKLLAAEFPSVKLAFGPRCGPGANRNAGARLASGEWLIFIDDDVIPSSGFVSAYLSAFETAADKTFFHGLTVATPEQTTILLEAPEVLGPLQIFPSCNFAIRRALYEKTEGFDGRYFPSFEDMEYCSRLQAQGEQCGFVQNALVHHPRRPLPKALTLARRWEPRVISSLDLGADPLPLSFLLTKHVALVILSRFRGQRPSLDTLRAALLFAHEFAWYLWLLPSWLWKHSRSSRSPFWELQQTLGNVPRRYGL
jgi:GT2 family glycosyltransferase